MRPTTIDNADEERRSHESAAESLRYRDLAKAARELLAACDMEEHNEAIMHGKKGKAWSGRYVRDLRLAAMTKIRALVPPDDWAEYEWNGRDDGLNHHNRQE